MSDVCLVAQVLCHVGSKCLQHANDTENKLPNRSNGHPQSSFSKRYQGQSCQSKCFTLKFNGEGLGELGLTDVYQLQS